MHAEPTFSIVTCTRNSAATLADTLASVRAQTWRDFEHIFVDGGSTDGTLAMLAAYPGARVLHDVGGGISRAMNAGVAAARGRFIAHLHSDDYYADAHVLASVAACVNAPHVDWVAGMVQVLRDDVLLPPFAQRPFSRRALRSGATALPHPAVFVSRRALQDAGGFDESLSLAMDIDLWLRLARHTSPVLIGRPLAIFREHAGSASTANKHAARAEEWRVRRRYLADDPLAFGLYCLRHVKRHIARRIAHRR